MQAITIRQPFVWEILTGDKTAEYRTWATTHRGPLALHASTSTASLVKGWRDRVITDDGKKAVDVLTFGVIVAVVDIVGCEWIAADRVYGWELANVRTLAAPIAIKGQLKLWELPPAVAAAVEAQLEEEPARKCHYCRTGEGSSCKCV